MSPYAHISSISEFSSATEVAKLSPAQRPYTTLPVVILALRVLSRTAILLVTDFTGHPDSGFAKGNSPKFLPSDFVIGTKRIDPAQVLAIGVPLHRVKYVWQSFECPELNGDDYDMETEERCDLSGLCIIMKLNFRIQAFREGLEGYYGHIYPWDHGLESDEHEIFSGFMNRLAQRMHPELYTQLSHRMPIEDYIPKAESTQQNAPESEFPEADLTASTFSNIVNRSAPMHTQVTSEVTKKRRLDPREAIYQQQFTQASQNNVSAPATNMLLLSEAQISTMSEEFVPNNRFRSVHETAPKPKVWNLRNKVEFEALCQIQCDEVPSRTAFETTAIVADIEPSPEFVFVKPFGRTLKISPIRILLTKSQKYLSVEASIEEDLCRFFAIDEVEMAIHHVGDFVMSLKSLPGKELRISIEKRTRKLASGHEFPYWGISSSLKNLHDQNLPGN